MRKTSCRTICTLLVALVSSGLAADEAAAAGAVRGVPWVGAPGIRMTTAQIMAEQAALDALPLPPEPFQERPLLGDRSRLPSAPPGPPATANTPGPEAPQTVGTGFLGVQFSESGNVVPPDSASAAGPTQILVAVNGRIKVFDKAGNLGALNASENTFFNSVRGGANTSDPRVRFDRLTNRWFVSIITVTAPNRILIATSDGPTITSSTVWTFFFFQQDQVGPTPNSDTGGLADFDSLGLDPHALYIGVNVFNAAGTSFIGSTAFVVRKSSLLAGGPIVVTAFRQLGTGTSSGPWAPQGVDNQDPSATQGYFIGVDTRVFSRLVLRRVSDPGGTPSISGNVNIPVATTTAPISVPASGSTRNLDGLDDRLGPATMINGHLWVAHNIQVNSSCVASSTGGRNGSRWYDITNLSGTPSVVQSGTLCDPASSSPRSFWIPSIAATGQGHAALATSMSSSSIFAGAATAGRLASDPPGTLRTFATIVPGAGSYNLQTNTTQRWGDYSAVTLDPCDNMTLWTTQEYVNAQNSWGVRVAQLLAPPPATPVSVSPAEIPVGLASVTVTITGSSDGASAFYDPGSGFACHIAVSLGPGVTVNSVQVTDATHLTVDLSTEGAVAGPRTITVTNPDGQSVTSGELLNLVRQSSEWSEPLQPGGGQDGRRGEPAAEPLSPS